MYGRGTCCCMDGFTIPVHSLGCIGTQSLQQFSAIKKLASTLAAPDQKPLICHNVLLASHACVQDFKSVRKVRKMNRCMRSVSAVASRASGHASHTRAAESTEVTLAQH